MSSGHFVTFGNFTFLGNIYTNQLVNTRWQLIPVLTSEDLDINNDSVSTMRHTKGSIANFTSLLTENRMKQAFFRSQFSNTLRRNFTNKDIAGTDLSTHTNNSTFVKISKCFLTYVRNIASDFFRSKLRITCFGFILLNVDRCINIFFDELLTKENRILIVVTFPSHEGYDHIAAQCQFTHLCGWTVSKDIAFFDNIAPLDNWTLVNACPLVRTHKFV
ncbi:hypothetical protein D3C72_801070 [compost metagenome]